MLKIASYNLENLFTRPSAMNFQHDAEGRAAIEAHALANAIVQKEVYSEEDKQTLVRLSQQYKWHSKNPPKSALVQLLRHRGQLFRNSTKQGLSVVAKGRGSWVGWFELLKEDVNWQATLNTGKVIQAQNPDILITIEVENRPTLERFNQQILKTHYQLQYPHVMVIDGNDERGIDLGIMSRFPIQEIRSHVDDRNAAGNRVFSRDCPEYDILLEDGTRLVVIPNHFKSKRNGDDKQSQARRIAQGKRAHAIALEALKRSPYVLIAGDLNDTPGSATLAELLKAGFVDVQNHATYPKDRPGTFDTGLAGNKIDYLILSPALWEKLERAGIERRGSFHPGLWAPFDTVTRAEEEASDHHLIWGEFGF